MSVTPFISVVIPAYNAAATLGETLRGLGAQAGTPKFEVIVVDNGSTDDTARIAARGGAIVLHEARRGPSAARNCGLRSARGAIVAHLDADTVPSRIWLREMARGFDRDATVLVAGNTLCYPPKTPAERYVHASGLYDTVRAIGRSAFPFAPSLNLAVKRDAAHAIGGWAEDMPTGEDVDFSHRLIARFGTPIVYAERAVLYHHTRADDAALAKQAWTYGEGAGDLYRRYPAELPLDARTLANIAWMLLQRTVLSHAAPAVRALGKMSDAEVEFARYHLLWTRAFWRGFSFTYRSGRRRQWA
jgi:glycosyltransferase involved in cell wall biosynthesis